MEGAGSTAGTSSDRAANILANAQNVQIIGSTLSIVGGNVHNHHQGGDGSGAAIKAVLQAIPNFRRIYQDMLGKATAGTGMWLLKNSKFGVWLDPNGDIKIFWGSGIPGAGKTVLASIVIKRLEALRREANGPVCICYVYFRYSDHAGLTVRNVLEIFLKQTVERHPDCVTVINETYAQHIREGTEPTEAELVGLLRQVIDTMAGTFYVLDALDEAPPRIQLAVLRTLATLNVKLFITSRPLKAVEAAFPQAHTFQIRAQDDDIKLHITKGINETADLLNLITQEGPTLQEEIISTIKNKSGGMFLHASLQTDALCGCVSVHQIKRTLDGFPSQIEDVYLQTWDRILEQNEEAISLAKAMLIWVLNASRSMSLDELERAVATSPETHKFEPERVVPGITLISLCRSLLVVEEESRLVRLVHYTAKETLQRLLQGSFPHPHSLLASVCMTYLVDCGFQNSTITSEEQFEDTLEHDPLLKYASEAWAFHARQSFDIEEIKQRTARFIMESAAFPAFTSVDRTELFDLLRPLHIVGLYHFPPDFIENLDLGNPNITTTICEQSPLMMAARSAHQDFLELLLRLSDIQVNQVRSNGWSALMLAARYGHAGVVTSLLANPKLQVNLVSKNGSSALMMAAKEDYVGIVILLLAHPEIEINLVKNQGLTALILAASSGYMGVVSHLLARPEIQINLVDEDGWSALIYAANNGYEHIVKLLLSHPDIQVNLVDEEGCSALIRAANNGYEHIVKLLLARLDIQVNQVDKDGSSALIHAARNGHEPIVKLLLAHPDIQVNLVDEDGWSALMMAANNDHKTVVRSLLAVQDINLNTTSSSRNTAIKLAAEEGNESIVRMLLDKPGIDVTIESTRDGKTAKSAALAQGHSNIVELLEEFESRNPSHSGPSGGCALDSTACEDVSDSDSLQSFHDAEEFPDGIELFASQLAVSSDLPGVGDISSVGLDQYGDGGSDSDSSQRFYDPEE